MYLCSFYVEVIWEVDSIRILVSIEKLRILSRWTLWNAIGLFKRTASSQMLSNWKQGKNVDMVKCDFLVKDRIMHLMVNPRSNSKTRDANQNILSLWEILSFSIWFYFWLRAVRKRDDRHNYVCGRPWPIVRGGGVRNTVWTWFCGLLRAHFDVPAKSAKTTRWPKFVHASNFHMEVCANNLVGLDPRLLYFTLIFFWMAYSWYSNLIQSFRVFWNYFHFSSIPRYKVQSNHSCNIQNK